MVGQSKGFGEGENMQSARFMGDKAYVVTFINTDPLFAFDLSDPTNPVITGEVMLPGYSAYMHPAGDGYMLGVGYDGTETGLNGNAKLSLFDVTDPENPVEVDRIVLNNGWFDTDYKAFLTKGDNGFIVLNEQYSYTGMYMSGATYVKVENGKLTLVSDIHLPGEAGTRKALFIGDTLYYFAQMNTSYVTEDGDYQSETLFAFDLNNGTLLSEFKF